MLVNPKEFLNQARDGHYAVPAPNFFDLDSARAYIEVAEKLNKPVILALAEAHLPWIDLEEGALIGKYFAQKAQVPVALHLDHGFSENVIEKALELGFTSCMIDASTDPFEKNVERSKAIVELAHAQNVQVEAEIGHVGAGENYEDLDKSDSIYTEVSEAQAFVDQTGVDSLAVSIGTAHGLYKGTPKLNFERLQQLREAINVPLVLHGSSGSGDENLNKCATQGIAKINVFTDFDQAAIKAIANETPKDYLQLKKITSQAIASTLEHYYGVFETR